jgi:hypothetical protein
MAKHADDTMAARVWGQPPYEGERKHGVPEQAQRCERGDIRYTVEALSNVPTTWYRLGVGIWESVT